MIVYQGKHVNKSFIAESLWPETEACSCKDNLYKVHNYLKQLDLPIKSARNEMWFEITEDMQIDFVLFNQLYKNKDDINICREIIEIHKSSFLYEEDYEWTTTYASYFEIKYLEVIEILIKFYKEQDNKRMVSYYEKILQI